MALQVGGLLVRTGLVWGAFALFGKYEAEAYAISGLVFYSAYLVTVASMVGVTWASIAPEMSSVMLTALSWIVAGAAVLAAAGIMQTN
jgi:hypothetical protein